MSPDQVRGEELDGRSDIYSLGIILYEILTGRRPFEAEEPVAVLHKQAYEEPVPVRKRRPELSKATAELVENCMRKERGERYGTAREVVEGIDEALQAEGTTGPNPQATQVLTHLHDSALISRQQVIREPTEEQAPRRKVPSWVIVTTLTLVLGLILLYVLRPFGESASSVVEDADPSSNTRVLETTEIPPTESSETIVEAATGDNEAETEAIATASDTLLPSETPLPTATQVLPTETTVPTNTPAPLNTPTSVLPQIYNGPDGVEMRLVPAGEFTMGSTSDDVLQAVSLCRVNPDGDSCAQSEFTSEMPQHVVYVSAFYMDVTEITNSQYRACANAGGCDPPDEGSGQYRRSEYFDRSQYANYPVVWVSWFDARDYCTWAGERLPTEAEWEKAARGTDARIYPWGNVFSSDRANTQDRGSEAILQVGQFGSGASPYGILDLAGNVWEYVEDWLDPDYYHVSPARDPHGPSSSPSGRRVLRSGSYANFQHYARVVNRGAVTPDSSTQFRGIRCVLDAR
jgi:serine/threonine-protein kinase